MKSIKELSDVYYEAVEAGDIGPYFPTTYAGLNDKIHGFQPQKLYILAGRPSMGKTAMAIDMAIGVAEGKGTVLFYSVESSEREIYERVHANVSGEAERLVVLPLYIDDNGGIGSNDIGNDCHEYSPDLVVVDYIQLMKTSGEGLRTEQLGAICGELKAISKVANCSMLVLSQLNRRVAMSEDHRPQMYDLRESGNLEQDADVIMMLHRPSYYYGDLIANDDWRTELIIRKNRSGPVGTVYLDFEPEDMKFYDI